MGQRRFPGKMSMGHAQHIIMALRWLALLFVCAAIACGTWLLLGHQLSIWSWHACPQNFWRESPAHCAFPFVSILQLGFTYGVIALLLLAAVAWLAPVRKFTACMLLLAGLALWPAYVLLFIKFSWFAMVSFAMVIAIAACFALGAFVTWKIAVKQDAPDTNPLF